jgi:cobyrinic acid a,c-diamide synthase
MSSNCPRLVIAGTGSGVGKTSLTLGLSRCLARQGLRVQTFKVGPDYLDPSYLKAASGRTCYNLDGWMTSREYVRRLFARATADADIAVIEGVMGLFDGAAALTLEGSTAEIAYWLDAPVLLVVNVHGVAGSLAATVKGFTHFDPELRVAGVIGNHGGSPRHRELLAETLSSSRSVPLVGMVPRGSLPPLPSRHLGLVAADYAELTPGLFDELADACSQHLDIPAIVELARSAGDIPIDQPSPEPVPVITPGRTVRLGIARDEAFHFYYADNLEELARCGAEWVPFSPLADRGLPPDLDGLYIGGGYPELYAARLAENTRMLADVRDYAASGRVFMPNAVG